MIELNLMFVARSVVYGWENMTFDDGGVCGRLYPH